MADRARSSPGRPKIGQRVLNRPKISKGVSSRRKNIKRRAFKQNVFYRLVITFKLIRIHSHMISVHSLCVTHAVNAQWSHKMIDSLPPPMLQRWSRFIPRSFRARKTNTRKCLNKQARLLLYMLYTYVHIEFYQRRAMSRAALQSAQWLFSGSVVPIPIYIETATDAEQEWGKE